MSNYRDIRGQRFGKLVAIEPVGKSNSHGILWKCKCDCGTIKNIRLNDMTSGSTVSCGCYGREKASERARKMGTEKIKHGHCRRKGTHPLFYVWYGMRGRCKYPSHISYKNYGAKGIRVCDEWEDFQTFYDWAMAHGYKKGLALDRIDADKDYCPDNCRFITQAENNRRQKRTIFIEYKGKRLTIPQWAEELGVNHATIRYRYNKGMSVEEILDPKKRPNNPKAKRTS